MFTIKHLWHSLTHCTFCCAWSNTYHTVGKSQGCWRTQKICSRIQSFSRIMWLHQGYFFDFSYSQSVYTEALQMSNFFFIIAGKYSVAKSSGTSGRWWTLFPTWEDWSLGYFSSNYFYGLLLTFAVLWFMFNYTFCILQEYIRHLEKEEEEQKRIQKVLHYHSSSSLIIFSSLHMKIKLTLTYRIKWEDKRGKTVIVSVKCWRNMVLMVHWTQELGGVITVHRFLKYLFSEIGC